MRLHPVLSLTSSASCLLLPLLFQIPAYAQQHRGETMQTQERSEAMVMTMLEARVEPDKWESLRRAYTSAGSKLPPQMVETFLVQSTSDPMLWRGISIWRSREALEEYRRSTETPGGVLIFRGAGAEPTLSILEVAVNRTNVL